jgi:hypothetical protein
VVIQAPTMPTKSEMMVRIGTMMTPASTRGSASLRTGSVPSARSAFNWSVTAIEPSSAAMPDPTRPATINAVSTGPSSLIIEALIRRPTTDRAPNWSSVMPDCSASTAPVKPPVSSTTVNDPTPTASSCSTTSR